MNIIENIAGEICKIIHSTLMSKVVLAGRLLSENKGIDALVRYVIENKNTETILLCGNDTYGHRPGHSLLCLYKNGIDSDGKIIGSQSPDPVLTLTKSQVLKFQRQVKLIDKIGETSVSKIKSHLNSMVH
jgi:tetrahydromethanopterin S-methyltransferase subunit A